MVIEMSVSFKRGREEDRAVTTTIAPALPALLNAKIGVTFQRTVLKRNHQVEEHVQYEKQDEGHKLAHSTKI